MNNFIKFNNSKKIESLNEFFKSNNNILYVNKNKTNYFELFLNSFLIENKLIENIDYFYEVNDFLKYIHKETSLVLNKKENLESIVDKIIENDNIFDSMKLIILEYNKISKDIISKILKIKNKNIKFIFYSNDNKILNNNIVFDNLTLNEELDIKNHYIKNINIDYDKIKYYMVDNLFKNFHKNNNNKIETIQNDIYFLNNDFENIIIDNFNKIKNDDENLNKNNNIDDEKISKTDFNILNTIAISSIFIISFIYIMFINNLMKEEKIKKNNEILINEKNITKNIL
jgi:hypothetical protein